MSSADCRHPGGLELTDRLVNAAALPRAAAVLDVGCGAGITVAHLVDEHGLHATGVDISRHAIAEAVEARPDLDLIVASAEALPFADGSFDAVVCECVLSTLVVPREAMEEAARVLRPGGAALISDLYVRSPGLAPQGRRVRALDDRWETVRLLADAGFEVTRWSDESGCLAQYVWDHAADRAVDDVPPPASRAACAGGRRIGYFSCVARRVAGGGGRRTPR